MATIPTISGSRVIAAPTGGVQMNADALMAPGRALVGLGGAIRQTSQVADEFILRKQNAINLATAADAEVQMEKAFADYQEQMRTNQDEETWVKGWETKAEEVRGMILGDPKLAPVLRDKLTNDFKLFAERTTSQVTTQANVRTIQRQKARLQNVADFMIQNGRLEDANHAFDTMEQAGLIFSEEKVKLQTDASQRVDFNLANRTINEDPFLALDQIQQKTDGGRWANYANLDENTREALKVEALRRVAALRAETVQGIVDRRNAGEIIKRDELQSMVDAKRLTPTQMKWVLQEQGRSGFDPKTTVHFAQALSRIDAYDPAKDPSNEGFAELVGERMAFPPQYRDELEKRLNRRLRPTAEDHLTKPGLDYVDDLLRGGFFGDVGITDHAANNLKEFQAAHGQAIQLRQELAAFVKQNPKATPMEQRDFINGRIAGQRSVRAAVPVLNLLTGQTPKADAKVITTKAEFDALPSGASFQWNGRTGTKK